MTSIYHLHLPPRVENALIHNGIETVTELGNAIRGCSLLGLKGLRKMGRETIEQAVQKIYEDAERISKNCYNE